MVSIYYSTLLEITTMSPQRFLIKMFFFTLWWKIWRTCVYLRTAQYPRVPLHRCCRLFLVHCIQICIKWWYILYFSSFGNFCSAVAYKKLVFPRHFQKCRNLSCMHMEQPLKSSLFNFYFFFTMFNRNKKPTNSLLHKCTTCGEKVLPCYDSLCSVSHNHGMCSYVSFQLVHLGRLHWNVK